MRRGEVRVRSLAIVRTEGSAGLGERELEELVKAERCTGPRWTIRGAVRSEGS